MRASDTWKWKTVDKKQKVEHLQLTLCKHGFWLLLEQVNGWMLFHVAGFYWLCVCEIGESPIGEEV